jgi:hydroxymethylglutaryl-CoA lyase
MPYPKRVTVVEVGLRDGLQSEPRIVPTEQKLATLYALADAGLRHIEAVSFVSPRALPQMADAAEVMARLDRSRGLHISALAPNPKGAAAAAAAQGHEIVAFVSASESHNKTNVRRPIDASLDGFGEVAAIARAANIPLRGAIATAFGCPFEGEVALASVMKIVRRYVELGVAAVSLGDSTGVATPRLVRERVEAIRAAFPRLPIGLHFHNTRGIGLVNVTAGLELGIDHFESSIGGIGGCPFAPGATGNICTEDLVYLLDELGVESGIDLGRLIEVAHTVEGLVGHPLPGQLMRAGPRLRTYPIDAARHAVG